MKLSKESIEINKRFFLAIDMLKQSKRIRGLHTFTKEYGINYWNMNTLKNDPEIRFLKPEYLAYLVRDYNISAEWLLLGRGGMFNTKLL